MRRLVGSRYQRPMIELQLNILFILTSLQSLFHSMQHAQISPPIACTEHWHSSCLLKATQANIGANVIGVTAASIPSHALPLTNLSALQQQIILNLIIALLTNLPICLDQLRKPSRLIARCKALPTEINEFESLGYASPHICY